MWRRPFLLDQKRRALIPFGGAGTEQGGERAVGSTHHNAPAARLRHRPGLRPRPSDWRPGRPWLSCTTVGTADPRYTLCSLVGSGSVDSSLAMGASWSPHGHTSVGPCCVYRGVIQRPRYECATVGNLYRRPLFLGEAAQGRLLSASPSSAYSFHTPVPQALPSHPFQYHQACALIWVPAALCPRWNSVPFALQLSWASFAPSFNVRLPNVPSSCIGGSGTTTKRDRTVTSCFELGGSMPHALPWLLYLHSFCGPLALSLWGIAALSVLQLLFHALPGRSSPLGRLMRLLMLGLPRNAVCPLARVGSSHGPIDWGPWRNRKGRLPRRVGLKPAVLWCFWSMLLLHLPKQVWAVQPSYRAAIQAARTLADALPEHLEAGIDFRGPPELPDPAERDRANSWPLPPPVIHEQPALERPNDALRLPLERVTHRS